MIQRIYLTAGVIVMYLWISIPNSTHHDICVTHERLGVVNSRAVLDRQGHKWNTDANIGMDGHETRTGSIASAAQYNENDRSWSMPARIIQLRNVSIYGSPGTIAQILYTRNNMSQYAWMVVRIDEYSFNQEKEPLLEGQAIMLEVSGNFVTSKGIDWSLCESADEYCQYASFIEGGFPTGDDYYGMPLSPSNMLIYSGYLPDDWINGMLAWRIKKSTSG